MLQYYARTTIMQSSLLVPFEDGWLIWLRSKAMKTHNKKIGITVLIEVWINKQVMG